VDEEKCTEELLRHVFRSATDEEIPMFKERVQCLREAGEVLCDVWLQLQVSSRRHTDYHIGIRRQLRKLCRQRQLLGRRTGKPPNRKLLLFPR
jgi:hypothetical protein